MARNIPALLLKILVFGLGVGQEILSLFFPDATRMFITTKLGVSDLTLVSWIIGGMVVFGLIMIFLVIIITVWQWHRSISKVPTHKIDDSELTLRQLRYHKEVRNDLLRIEKELYNIKQPRLIQFESWNAFTKPDPRRADINNDGQYDAIQNFSTVLNKRNNYVGDKLIHGDQDPEFLRLNNECVSRYEKIRDTGFLDIEIKEVKNVVKTELAKQEIWNTIEKWVKPYSVTSSRLYGLNKQYDFPLVKDPQERAIIIKDCLNKNYHGIWENLKELRQTYADWESNIVPPKLVKERQDRGSNVNFNEFQAYKDSLLNDLKRKHDELVEQFNSEILLLGYSRLKC